MKKILYALTLLCITQQDAQTARRIAYGAAAATTVGLAAWAKLHHPTKTIDDYASDYNNTLDSLAKQHPTEDTPVPFRISTQRILNNSIEYRCLRKLFISEGYACTLRDLDPIASPLDNSLKILATDRAKIEFYTPPTEEYCDCCCFDEPYSGDVLKRRKDTLAHTIAIFKKDWEIIDNGSQETVTLQKKLSDLPWSAGFVSQHPFDKLADFCLRRGNLIDAVPAMITTATHLQLVVLKNRLGEVQHALCLDFPDEIF